MSVGNVTQAEGDSGTTDFVFTVSLSDVSVDEITVQYATSDSDGATEGVDYTGASGTLTFAAGQTEQLITVLVTGDELDESNEQFSIVLSGAVNAIEGGPGTGTITVVP